MTSELTKLRVLEYSSTRVPGLLPLFGGVGTAGNIDNNIIMRKLGTVGDTATSSSAPAAAGPARHMSLPPAYSILEYSSTIVY